MDILKMKCRYEFTVSSTLYLDPPLKFQFGRYNFELHNKDKRFSKLIIESEGVRFSEQPRIERTDNNIPHIKLPNDPELLFLKPEMRAIRGALSMWGVHNIDVENPTSSWQPETKEEKKNTTIFSATISKKDREDEPPMKSPLDIIIRSIVSRDRLIEYEVPFEFYRRGAEDLYEERYIEAIYDFYFVFEYLWGNGKFRKKEIISQFSSSPQAVASIVHAQENPPDAITSIKSDLNLYRKNYSDKSPEKIFEYIVDLRGFLHHQSPKRKKNWKPSSDINYIIDSHFLHIAAHQSVFNIYMNTLFDKKEIEKFKKTKVYTKDNNLVDWIPM